MLLHLPKGSSASGELQLQPHKHSFKFLGNTVLTSDKRALTPPTSGRHLRKNSSADYASPVYYFSYHNIGMQNNAEDHHPHAELIDAFGPISAGFYP